MGSEQIAAQLRQQQTVGSVTKAEDHFPQSDEGTHQASLAAGVKLADQRSAETPLRVVIHLLGKPGPADDFL